MNPYLLDTVDHVTRHFAFAEGEQAILSHAHEVDINELAGDWLYYQENCGNYPASQKTFSQFLQEKLKGGKE